MTMEQTLGPLPARRWWAPLCGVLGVLSLSVVGSDGWQKAWLGSVVLLFSLSCAGPAVVAFALAQVSRLRSEMAGLVAVPLRAEVRPRYLIASGTAFLGLALISSDAVTALPFIGWARALAVIVVGSAFASYGALAYVFAMTLALAVQLGTARVRADVFAWPSAAIGRTHALYFRLVVIGGGLYLLGVTVVWLSPGGSRLAMNEAWARLWVVPPGVAVLVYFAAFNVALHNLLLQCRARAESEITARLQTLYDGWKESREPSVETSISALLSWRESIRLERLWPMDLKTGIATALTILIPTIETVLKLVGSAIETASASP